MRLLVQKFGGTSLSTAQARRHVVNHIKKALSEFQHLVVVVSAMGRKGDPYATDTLLDWIRQNGNRLPDREKDMLLYCGETISAVTLCSLLEADDIPACVLNGAQAGIITNEMYGNAQITAVQPARIHETLARGRVVIVTGFQGRTADYDFTTLGRGGSDTSAAALGVALEAERVDIFTDVSGVLTADPNLVENAKRLDVVTFAEIGNMATNGAKVIHPRAVEIAMSANLPLRIRSTFSEDEGTLIVAKPAAAKHGSVVADRFVTAIANRSDVTQIAVEQPEVCDDELQVKVFKTMAKLNISVDFINVNPSGVVFTVADAESGRAETALRSLGFSPRLLSGCAKVSVIGGGINGVPGIMARIVEALIGPDIAILQSADSNTTIWVLVRGRDMARAVRVLHETFRLHQ